MRVRTWQWLRIAGLLAAFTILVYLFRDADPREIWSSLTSVEPIYFVPVVIGIIGMFLARALRLKYIMEPKLDLPLRRVFVVYNVGQLLNILLPALTGQVGRVILFSRTLQITKTFAFTVVILEVLFDGIVLVMMIFAASFLVVMPDWMLRGEVVILVACLMLLGFFYLVLHRHRKEKRLPSWFRRRMPGHIVCEWDNVKASFLEGLDMLTSRRHLFMTVLLSVFSWLAHALMVLFLLRAFSIEVPFWGAIVILIVNTLAIMVPVSPGNVGTFQLACIFGLSLVGVSKEEALAFSIPLHVMELLPIFVLGAFSSFSAHVRLREFMGPEVLAGQERLTATEGDQCSEDSRLECASEKSATPVSDSVASPMRLSSDRHEL